MAELVVVQQRSVYARALAVNAVVLVAGAVALALTPATVSSPIAAIEAVVLAFGLGVLVGVNALLLRVGARSRAARASAAVPAATTAPEVPEPARLAVCADYVVDADDGTALGVVDEIVAGPDGQPVALVVADGWLGRRRLHVPAGAVRHVGDGERRLVVDGSLTQP